MSMRPPSAKAGRIPWCHLEVLHDYLDGAGHPECDLLPTPETRTALAKLGITVRQAGCRFTLYLETARRNKGWAGVLAASELCFLLTVRRPEFHAYTDLPMEPGKMLYLSTGAARGRRAGGRLTVNARLSVDDLLPLTGGRFLYQPSRRIPPGTLLSILDRRGLRIAAVIAPEPRAIPIDVTLFGPGYYDVRRGKQSICRFLAEASLARTSALAFVSVLGRDVMGRRPGPDPAKAEDAPLYKVTFPARASIWRYDIFTNGQAADGLSIQESPTHAGGADAGQTPPSRGRRKRAPVRFRKVTGIPGRSSEVSVSFESSASRPIPMRARPERRLQLMRAGQAIIDALPTPALGLSPGADGRRLYSRMIVHL